MALLFAPFVDEDFAISCTVYVQVYTATYIYLSAAANQFVVAIIIRCIYRRWNFLLRCADDG